MIAGSCRLLGGSDQPPALLKPQSREPRCVVVAAQPRASGRSACHSRSVLAVRLALGVAAVEHIDAEAVEAVAARRPQPGDAALASRSTSGSDGACARSQARAAASGETSGRQRTSRETRHGAAGCDATFSQPSPQPHIGRAHACGCVSGRRAADGQPVHAQGRLADADRHALAVLAAGADAVVERAGRCRSSATLVSASGPLPIRVAPLTAGPTLPSSIR